MYSIVLLIVAESEMINNHKCWAAIVQPGVIPQLCHMVFFCGTVSLKATNHIKQLSYKYLVDAVFELSVT